LFPEHGPNGPLRVPSASRLVSCRTSYAMCPPPGRDLLYPACDPRAGEGKSYLCVCISHAFAIELPNSWSDEGTGRVQATCIPRQPSDDMAPVGTPTACTEAHRTQLRTGRWLRASPSPAGPMAGQVFLRSIFNFAIRLRSPRRGGTELLVHASGLRLDGNTKVDAVPPVDSGPRLLHLAQSCPCSGCCLFFCPVPPLAATQST